MRQPLNTDAELQAKDQLFAFRQYSYDLTQKLTYYVISVELIFCGYMLLNAEKLAYIHGASYLFLTCGAAAFFGIFWRFFYNETHHNDAHGISGRSFKISLNLQIICYWIYIVLSIIAFVWALISGFAYLQKTVSVQSAAELKQPTAIDNTPSTKSPIANSNTSKIIGTQPILSGERCEKNVQSSKPEHNPK